MVGSSLTRLVPDCLRHIHRSVKESDYKAARRHGVPDTVRISGLHKLGQEIPLEISLGEFFADNQPLFTAVGRDVTERISTEVALATSYKEYVPFLQVNPY